MKEYVLKVYGPRSPPYTARRLMDEWIIQADDDGKALSQAAELAKDVPYNGNAVLYGSGPKPLWLKAPWNA